MISARTLSRLDGEPLRLMAGEACNRIGRFVLLLLIARQFGPEVYGTWILALSVATFLANGGDFGIATVVTREVAADLSRSRKYLAHVLAITPAIVVPGSAALLVSSVLMASATMLPLLILLGVGGILESATLILLAILRAHGRMQSEALIRAFQGTFLLAAGSLLASLGAAPLAIAGLFPAVALISTFVALWFLRRSLGLVAPALDLRFLAGMIRSGAPIFASTLAFFAYFRVDAFLLAHLKGEAATGLYGAAYNVAFGAAFLPMMFGRTLLHRFAATDSGSALRAAYAHGARTTALLAAGLSAALLVAAPFFRYIYGQEFSGAQAPYLLLVGAQLLYFHTHLNNVFLVALNRAKEVWCLVCAALVLNVGANLVLIPPYETSGAALAMIISESVLLVAQAVRVRSALAESDWLAARTLAATSQEVTARAA